jgi:hypothetical protein
MLPPVKVGNVKSGACDGLEELQLTATPSRARIGIIRAIFIDTLLAILVTSWHKPAEILQVTGQHQNSHTNKQYCGYYGGDEGMAAKPSDVS